MCLEVMSKCIKSPLFFYDWSKILSMYSYSKSDLIHLFSRAEFIDLFEHVLFFLKSFINLNEEKKVTCAWRDGVCCGGSLSLSVFVTINLKKERQRTGWV